MYKVRVYFYDSKDRIKVYLIFYAIPNIYIYIYIYIYKYTLSPILSIIYEYSTLHHYNQLWYIYIYIYISPSSSSCADNTDSLSLSLSLYIYIYIYLTHTHTHTHIHTHTHHPTLSSIALTRSSIHHPVSHQ